MSGVYGVDAWGTTAFGMPGGPGDADLFSGFGMNSTPIGTRRGYRDLAQALHGSGVVESQHWNSLFDALEVGDVAAAEVLANLIASVNATGSVHSAFKLSGTAADGVEFFDSVMAAWRLLVEEHIAVAGDAAGKVRKLAALIDALAATGQAESNLAAFAACTSAIALEGLIAQGFNAEAVEQILLADTATAVAKLLGPLVDGVLVSDTGAASMRISAITTDGVAVDADPATLLRANADLADGVLLYASLRLDGTDYVGWALNTDLRAASEHRNAAFDAFATFKGKHYAGGPGGLVHFTGDTENGDPIAASIRTALLDFGTSRFKRVPDAFIGMTDAGEMVLKVITREPVSGRQIEDWYRVERLPAEGPGTGRVKIGRGLKSTWWQFELHNINGADFALNSIELRPLYLDRRT